MTTTIGLDVGGAHMKVAVLENGQLTGAHQFVCPLWQGLDKLDAALSEAQKLTADASTIAITMTGELSDLFETREQGVHALVDRLQEEYGNKTKYWMGRRGFGKASEAKTYHKDVGSTNFIATSMALAMYEQDAVLIDMGSTTTDIIPILDATPLPTGLTDAQRLKTGELVYTGATRTPIMAVSSRVPFMGQWQTLVREHLATMADIYRLLNELREGIDLHDTADGRGKSFDESLTRFARMMGRDREDLTEKSNNQNTRSPVWKAAAMFIACEQARSIENGIYQVLSAHPKLNNPKIITAGIGSWIITRIAANLGFKTTSFGERVGAVNSASVEITQNAPAAAVALLIRHRKHRRAQ